MKNLQLLELISKSLQTPLSPNSLFSVSSDSTFFISNKLLYKHDFLTNTIVELCPLNFEEAIHLKVLTIEKKICIVAQNTIYVVDPDCSKEVQTINFSSNISAISWNSSEELVAIVFDSGTVATYSLDYENGDEYLQGESSVVAQIPDTVYVGWGSKDTQFRGSEGKLKKQAVVESKPVEDQRPRVSWRGNGEMFVVNYWENEKRKFVVFETPCRALFRSEECPGLQPLVAWRPTGNMIATVTETNIQSVVIFEKNGQKRFTFDLDFGNVTVLEIQWSPCAQILTILTQNLDTQTQTIHLLMSSNYKWYEKQTLNFTTENPLLHFEWLENTQFTFSLKVTTQSEIVKYIFTQTINSLLGICAVINGKNLQFTDFTESVVPPIMYQQKFTNNAEINFVSLYGNLAAILDSGNSLKIFDISDLETVICFVDLATIPELSKFPLACHHLLLQDSVVYLAAEAGSETTIYNINCQNGDANFIDVVTGSLKHLIISNGSVQQVHDNSQNVIRHEIAVIENDSYTCKLSSNCHFFVNDHKISDCVNSFAIFDSYLLYTTKLNELRCLKLDKSFPNVNIFRRSIEQGAILVTPVKNSPKLVLQLPRGNLETISCRLISIDILDNLLNDDNWGEALRFIRLEKLNANLLFDLAPERFLGKIDKFVNGVTTINELNSLCLEFEAGNVLNTIYKNTRKDNYPGKIDAIFGGILQYFDKVDYADFITTIMIINLNYFTLREALIYLQDLLRRGHTNVALKQKLIEAVNCLKTYGCDQNKLYTEALFLYDLDLANFVASCCQLDPRVYEPHLNNLKNMSEVEKRFEINVYGKKPKSAILYLLRCPATDSETVLAFIQNNGVFREAYENCSKNNCHFQTVSRAFAQSLSQQKKHHEAGVVLKRGGLLEEALEEFIESLRWREALDILQELKIEKVKKLMIINDLGKKLTRFNTIKDAAILYEFYANNYEMAVKLLLRYGHVEEAMHIAKKYNRNDIIVSEVIPLLQRRRSELESILKFHGTSFENYSKRLAQVRKNKVEKFSNVGDDDRDDLFSDVASTISRSSRSSRSRSSTASSRNRRKEERKKLDLREGGVYEDIALVRWMYETIKEFYKKGEEVRVCCLLLLQETDVSYDDVKKLYDCYWEIHTKIKNGISQIWPPHFRANNNTQNVQELADLENFEHLDVEFRTPPSEEPSWNLGLF